MFINIIAFIVLAYIFARIVRMSQEAENDNLKRELVYVKEKRQEEKDHYQDRIYVMNDALDQFRKGSE